MKGILKLDKDDEKKEIEFELDYLRQLTIQQRFDMMFKKTKEIKKLLRTNGIRTTNTIIKRT